MPDAAVVFAGFRELGVALHAAQSSSPSTPGTLSRCTPARDRPGRDRPGFKLAHFGHLPRNDGLYQLGSHLVLAAQDSCDPRVREVPSRLL